MSKRKAAAARARSRGAYRPSSEELVSKRAGEYWQRFITGATSTKSYVCPGCNQQIRPATPHYVVWPDVPSLLESEGINERRHWHKHCWERHS